VQSFRRGAILASRLSIPYWLLTGLRSYNAGNEWDRLYFFSGN